MAYFGDNTNEGNSGGVEVIMKSTWIDYGVATLLGLMIVADAAMYLHMRTLTGREDQNLALLSRFPGKQGISSPPDGFTSEGMRVEITPKTQLGWAVRYASPGCEYCREDEHLWSQLSSKLQQLHYQVIVIVPNARDEFPNDSETPKGALQEAFVNMEWIRQFRLSSTPTLLIVDRNQGLIWSRQGTLNPADPSSAVRAIQASYEKSK